MFDGRLLKLMSQLPTSVPVAYYPATRTRRGGRSASAIAGRGRLSRGTEISQRRDRLLCDASSAMYLLVILGISGAIGLISLAVVLASARRRRPDDLGSVSAAWTTE